MADVKLTKAQIKLVDEAVNLAAEMKLAEERLDTIKAELKVLPAGTYATSSSILSVSLRDIYEGPTPAVLLAKLKDMKMKDRFVDCVKVLATDSRKIIGEETFNALRTFKCSSSVLSFKKVTK